MDQYLQRPKGLGRRYPRLRTVVQHKLEPLQPEAYGYNPRGHSRWLQKLALRFLSIHGSPIQSPVESFVSVIDWTDDVMDVLYTQVYESMAWGRRGSEKDWRVILGREQFGSLLKLPEGCRYLDQRFGGREPHIIGLRLTVLPWFDGVLVIPE